MIDTIAPSSLFNLHGIVYPTSSTDSSSDARPLGHSPDLSRAGIMHVHDDDLEPPPSRLPHLQNPQDRTLSIFPLISILFNTYTWMLHGYLDENFFPVFTTFGVGTIIALCYVAIFYRCTSNRTKANRLLTIFGAALATATAYAVIGGFGLTGQTRHEAAQSSGYIAISSSLVLYTSPLEKILLVFKHKSAVFIPIQMVIAGSINNTMWIIYTSLAGKWLMFWPNIFTLSAGVFQVILYFFVYNPKTHPYIDESKERSSTATTEDDDSSSEEQDCEVPSVSEDCEEESGNYMAVATPVAAHATPEMLV